MGKHKSDSIPLLLDGHGRWMVIAIDNYRPEFARKNLGLFARWFAERGVPVALVTNATPTNASIQEVWPGVPLLRLSIPGDRLVPLHHATFYRFVRRNRRRIGYLWLYRGRRYVAPAALIVKLSGGSIILKLDGQGGVLPGTSVVARSPLRFLLPYLSVDGARRAAALRPPPLRRARMDPLRKLTHALLLPLRWAAYDLPLALANVVLAESTDLQASVGAYDKGGKVLLYPNALPLDELHAVERRLLAQGVTRQRVVLTVGRITAAKGMDSVLRAFAKVPEEARSGWSLRIVGPVEDEAHLQVLRSLARELQIADEVEFIPGLYGLDLYRAYLEASVFAIAHPGWVGGASNVVAEAMAFGCTVISTAVGEVPYQLDDGRCGVLVPPDNDDALSTGLTSLIADTRLRASLAAEARRRVEDHFSLESRVLEVARRLRSPNLEHVLAATRQEESVL